MLNRILSQSVLSCLCTMWVAIMSVLVKGFMLLLIAYLVQYFEKYSTNAHFQHLADTIILVINICVFVLYQFLYIDIKIIVFLKMAADSI